MVHAIYEGHLAEPDTAAAIVRQVLEAGFKPVIAAIHARPEKALFNTVPRFDEIGRGASIHTMARIQGGLSEELAAVRDTYGDAVELRVVDRCHYTEPAQHKSWNYTSLLKSKGDHERIKQRLEHYLEARRDSLSTDAYRQAAGLATIGCGGRVDVKHENPVNELSALQGNRKAVGLNVPTADKMRLVEKGIGGDNGNDFEMESCS